MNQTISRTIRGAAFGAFATLFLFGSAASACSFPGGQGLRSVNFADPSVRLNLPRPAGIKELDAQRGGGGPASVQGLWQVTYSSGGAVVDMAYEVFHSDGTEAIIDVTPPAEGNSCFGVYVQMTPTTYKLTHPGWTFDASGNLTGTESLDVTVNVTSANTFSGTFTLTFYDLRGTKGQVFTGTMTATRIVPNY
jgi:hypothetical protein